MVDSDDDLLELRDDEIPPPGVEDDAEPWRILIVDDEDQVHQVTRFALEGTRILGRTLHFDSAYSGIEARKLLEKQKYSCILLDVVMESEDAGLKLVGEIRERFDDPAVRIVLRTGQPGYAPEIEVIQKYDINDYRAKSELTSQRLTTTLIAALRSFQQIRTIEANREGLRMILDAASSLMAVKAVRSFAEGVLTQICAMLQIESDGVLCVQAHDDEAQSLTVLAASGDYAERVGQLLQNIGDSELTARVQRVLAAERSEFGAEHAVLFIRSPRAERLVVHVATSNPIPELDKRLLELFSINIAIGLDNAQLFEELETMAFHDPLTGLWNRASLERELETRCKQNSPVVLLLADIDNFQAVNDGLGHSVGDRTLKAAAAVLAEVFGEQTFIARPSADSFALIYSEDGADPGISLESRLAALNQQLGRNLDVDGNEVPLTMTLGLARFPEHGASASALFRNAGIALKQGKRGNRAGHQYFDDHFERELQTRLDTVRELRSVLEKSSLKLLYQPQLALDGEQIFGAEALVRWHRDGVGWVLPDTFIPAAEDSGQIVAMGEWILREACRQQVSWARSLGRPISIAVNVSPRQLRDLQFAAMVRKVLEQTGIEPQYLELEITESMLMLEGERVNRLLAELRQTGLKVAIDDFGTGHSSLSRLQRLPIDRLKIDRSFVTGLVDRPEDQVIVAMIINMGHLLGHRVLAEGVETEHQRDQLRSMGCDEAQGYLFGHPIEAHALLERLRGVGPAQQ